jgi:hypothetical protein
MMELFLCGVFHLPNRYLALSSYTGNLFRIISRDFRCCLPIVVPLSDSFPVLINECCYRSLHSRGLMGIMTCVLDGWALIVLVQLLSSKIKVGSSIVEESTTFAHMLFDLLHNYLGVDTNNICHLKGRGSHFPRWPPNITKTIITI